MFRLTMLHLLCADAVNGDIDPNYDQLWSVMQHLGIDKKVLETSQTLTVMK